MRRGGYPDRCLGWPPFRPERPFFRQERPPFCPQPQAYPRRWQQPPEPQPCFFVLLLCSRSTQKGLSPSYIRDLLVSCPSTSENFFYSQGAVVGKLTFRRWANALEAAIYLWGCRLDGAHHLTTKIESSIGLLPSQTAKEESHLRALFTGHIRGLLECKTVRRCEGKIEQVENEIKKASVALAPSPSERERETERDRRGMGEGVGGPRVPWEVVATTDTGWVGGAGFNRDRERERWGEGGRGFFFKGFGNETERKREREREMGEGGRGFFFKGIRKRGGRGG